MAQADLNSALAAIPVRYPDLVRRDVINALQTFRDLHPQGDSFTFSDSVRRPVISLSGTVPVLHKGSTYNIPICLYLLDTHPYHPPICFVKPTADMMIKTSQHVDSHGRIYLPYLSEWQYGKCDLMGLLQIMVLVFQDQCPVFSRGGATAAQTPYPSAGSGGTPYPVGLGYGMPAPVTGVGSGASYPYPSYAGTNVPYPMSTSAGYSSQPHTSYPYSTSVTPASTAVTASNYQSQTSVGSSGTIQPEHIRASLLSAIEDRMRRRLFENLGLEHAELQSIRKTREDLNAGEKTLKSMLQRLQSEETALQESALTYGEKKEEIDKILAAAPKDGELSIDDAIDTTSPLYRQLVDCYVKDNTIEDAIYYLGQSLKKGQIDLDNFLKSVRKLSRDQFVLRATMQKCRQKAGLSS